MAVAARPRSLLLHPAHATRAENTGATHHPAVAERVGLVEEDDDSAIAQRQLAQLAEHRLDLEDPDTHEHIDEGAWVDEHERLARLAGDGFGHEGLACAGRAPEQDAAGNIAAPLLDGLWVLEEDHALFHMLHYGVLAPNTAKTRLYIVREICVDTAPGEEKENCGELAYD